MADLGVRYANALFELSREAGTLDVTMQQALFLCETFAGEEGALRILTHPLITANEKNAFVDKVYGASVGEDLLGFMKLAIAKNRESFLLATLRKLVEIIKLYKFQITARVVTAVPLEEAQKARLVQLLSAKSGKRVEIIEVIDPMQIAGISIHVDGFFLDRTVKTLLKNMKETFEMVVTP